MLRASAHLLNAKRCARSHAFALSLRACARQCAVVRLAKRCSLVVTWALVATMMGTAARADSTTTAARPEEVSIRVDNDVGSSDEDYSSGIFVSVVGPDVHEQWLASLILQYVGAVTSSIGAPTTHLQPTGSIRQQLYTPHFYWFSNLRTRERPFAAVLAGSAGVLVSGARDLVRLDVDIGAVGRLAFPHAAQTVSHRFFSPWSPTPDGWQHQIGDAPYIAARGAWTHSVLALDRGTARVLAVDVTGAFESGTILNHSEAGVAVRGGLFGRDGRHNEIFGSGALDVVGLNVPEFLRPALTGLEVDVTLGLFARHVLQNGLVAGTPFSVSPHVVPANPFVARVEGGVRVAQGPLMVSVTHVGRSRETQLPTEEEWHRWWRIEFGFRF